MQTLSPACSDGTLPFATILCICQSGPHHTKEEKKKKKHQLGEQQTATTSKFPVTYLILLLNKKTGNRR